MPDRTYLDWNATAPLRPEARAAMIAAMDVVGNPSSVHTEGRAAKMIVEKARDQVAALVGCDTEEVVFTSGATEAAGLAVAQKQMHGGHFRALSTEHDCLFEWSEQNTFALTQRDGNIDYDCFGEVMLEITRLAPCSYLDEEPSEVPSNSIVSRCDETGALDQTVGLIAASPANGETGLLLWRSPRRGMKVNASTNGTVRMRLISDVVQLAGKSSILLGDDKLAEPFAILSGHKLGSSKGVGCLINRSGLELEAIAKGGGQEKGRRSGTENVIGIAGFGAAAEAAQRDLDAGAWEPIAELRDDLEAALRDCAGDDLTIFGETAPRLPNTSCFAIPGWKGETQVMQLDLAGFAVSAGSACSSGKVGPSRVLKAMGYDDITASSAIRVSMGATTTKDEVSRFIDAWTGLYKRMKTRAA